MSRSVYYPTDVRNALLAAEQAVNAASEAAGDTEKPFAAGFVSGYRAALTTVALAFGLVSERGKAPPPASDGVLFARRA